MGSRTVLLIAWIFYMFKRFTNTSLLGSVDILDRSEGA